ncbi:MAG TPA: hypothetical protein VKX45_00380 [Bryobacteraceae bacterium]|jgi:hypothetical protein|nr:hypothetical protein [Bryobacteraceae bacterium]
MPESAWFGRDYISGLPLSGAGAGMDSIGVDAGAGLRAGLRAAFFAFLAGAFLAAFFAGDFFEAFFAAFLVAFFAAFLAAFFAGAFAAFLADFFAGAFFFVAIVFILESEGPWDLSIHITPKLFRRSMEIFTEPTSPVQPAVRRYP